MKKIFAPHFLLHLFLCMIVFIFIINANAESERDIALEGDMVKIPAGSFPFGTNKKDRASEALLLGIPKPWYADEGPEQKIFLKTFYIDRHEVTNRRYKIYIDDVSAVTPTDWIEKKYSDGKGNYPVINISWYLSIACNRATAAWLRN